MGFHVVAGNTWHTIPRISIPGRHRSAGDFFISLPATGPALPSHRKCHIALRMKYVNRFVRFNLRVPVTGNAYTRPAADPRHLIFGIAFLLLPGALFGIKPEPARYCESVGQAGWYTYPDNTTLLPCTDQFADDLAKIDWRKGLEAGAGWRAAFATAAPVFAAYKRYKNCLRQTYPEAGNTP